MDVLIADDHPLVRDALATIVRQLDADARLVQVGDYPTLVEHLSAEVPDLLLIDLNMPGTNGLDGLRRLRQQFPSLAVIVASGQDDPATIRGALATRTHRP